MMRVMATYEQKAFGACVVAVVVGMAIAAWLVAWLILSIIEQRTALADLQAAIARAEAERAGLANGAGGSSPLASRLFKAASAAEFQSQLQSHVKDIATKHKVSVDSLQIMNAERAVGLNRLSLRLDAAVPNSALGSFLAELATGEPLVLLQSMELRPLMQHSNRLNNGGVPANSIAARFDLTAYAANAATGATAGRGRVP